MGAYDVPIINGRPGTTWTNNTGEVMYQFVCDLVNTCGACLQYHLRIGTFWPIPIHRRCRCSQTMLFPGDTGRPFVDFLRLLETFTHEQQVEAIGASNYRLLEAGLISWSDIVTEGSVHTLREVVWAVGLTIPEMIDAGVAPYIAEAAYAAAHASEAAGDAEKLAELVDALRGAGMSEEDIARLLATAIGSGVSLVPAGTDGSDASMHISDLDAGSLLGGD